MGNVFCPIIKGITNKIEQIVLFDKPGTHEWIVPENIKSVNVFLVGGGGGGATGSGGGGSYTKTYKGSGYLAPTKGTWQILPDGGRDGNAIKVTPGESIQISVGKGGLGLINANTGAITRAPLAGGFSQFKNSNYRAEGGNPGEYVSAKYKGGSGGSAGGGYVSGCYAGSDGADAAGNTLAGKGQGHTTRDFGELTGKINAGGGGSGIALSTGERNGGYADYTVGNGGNGTGAHYGMGGGGYGGGGGGSYGNSTTAGAGGNGVVMIRFKVAPIKQYDPLLNNFVNKLGVTSFTESELASTNLFIKSLRENNSLFNKLIWIHPYIGKTALPRSLNLLDADKYNITFSGNVSHDDLYTVYNTGVGKINLTAGKPVNTNMSMTFYVPNHITNTVYDIMQTTTVPTAISGFYLDYIGYGNMFDCGSVTNGRLTTVLTPTGTLTANVDTVEMSIWQNGEKKASKTSGFTQVNIADYVYNPQKTSNQRLYGIACVTSGLTAQEVIDFHKIINTYMIALGRTV